MRLCRFIFVFLALLASFAAPARAADSVEPESFTWHDYTKQLLELNKQTLAGAYKEHGKHGAWDDQAVAFLDQIAVYFTYSPRSEIYRDEEVVSPDKLVEAGRAVQNAGCADPLVGYCLGAILQDTGHADEALPLLRPAPAALKELNYPDRRVWAAARRLAAVEPNTDAGKNAKTLADDCVIKLSCGKLSPIERREALSYVREHIQPLKRDQRNSFLERFRKQPDIDPWVRDVIDGGDQIDVAWEFRGGGWASTVTEEGWKGFFEHLTLARERLVRAWELAPQLPEAPSLMITVAMGGGDHLGEKEMTWFDRAMAAQIDNLDAYDRIFNALLPRWGGSQAEMYDIGLRGAQTKRFDTDAPWQLVHAVHQIVDDAGQGWPAELSRPGVYEQLSEVVDAYAKYYEHRKPHNSDWYRTFHAALAWRAEKYAEARRILDKLDKRIDLSAFSNIGAKNPLAGASQVYAFTSAEAELIRGAEAAAGKKESEAALADFKSAREKLKDSGEPDSKALFYLDQRITSLGRELGLAKGEKVSCQPDPGFEGWRWLSGKWEVIEGGTLTGRFANKYSPVMLISDDIGSRFEVSGKAGHSGGDSRPAVVLSADNNLYCYIVLYEKSVVIHFPHGKKIFPREQTRDADFVIRFDDGTVNVRVNDKLIVDDFALPDEMKEDPHAGVGVVDQGRGFVKFNDLKIRRLTDADPALEAKSKAETAPPTGL